MTEEQIIGKTVKEIYETQSSKGDDLLGLGKSHYFSIIIELEDYSRFELGIHDIREWQSNEVLTPSNGTSWADEQKLQYKNKKIAKIVKRDPNEYFEGSLSIVLENDVLIEHQCSYGDQLFIDKFQE